MTKRQTIDRGFLARGECVQFERTGNNENRSAARQVNQIFRIAALFLQLSCALTAHTPSPSVIAPHVIAQHLPLRDEPRTAEEGRHSDRKNRAGKHSIPWLLPTKGPGPWGRRS